MKRIKQVTQKMTAAGIIAVFIFESCIYAYGATEKPIYYDGCKAGEYLYEALGRYEEDIEVEIITGKSRKKLISEIEQGRLYSKLDAYGMSTNITNIKEHKYYITENTLESGKKKYRIKYMVTYVFPADYLKKYNSLLDKKIYDMELDRCRTARDKVKKIYKYICTNVEYCKKTENSATAPGAFLENKANCKGFAELMFDMCNKAGVKCAVIYGSTESASGEATDHAWNIVKVGNKWYNVDCSWDAGKSKYKYFLKTDEYFRQYKHYRYKTFLSRAFISEHKMQKN